MLRRSAQLHPADAARRLSMQHHISAATTGVHRLLSQDGGARSEAAPSTSEEPRGWGSAMRCRGRTCAEEDAQRWQDDGAACVRYKSGTGRARVQVASTRLRCAHTYRAAVVAGAHAGCNPRTTPRCRRAC